jgi:hypothetical protein
MKIRNGFVSNSSTSSFLCCVCGSIEAGMDIGINDAGMYECVKGHVFCQDHNTDNTIPIRDCYEVPSDICPICQLQTIENKNVVKFLLKKLNTSYENVHSEIVSIYHTDYDRFISNINNASTLKPIKVKPMNKLDLILEDKDWED